MSIIKYVTLQKIVAHDFRYDPRIMYTVPLSVLHSYTHCTQHKDSVTRQKYVDECEC